MAGEPGDWSFDSASTSLTALKERGIGCHSQHLIPPEASETAGHRCRWVVEVEVPSIVAPAVGQIAYKD